MPKPLLLAVDGNGMLHRAFHAWGEGGETDREGRPIWALLGLLVSISAAAARLRPDAVLVGFDCESESLRRDDYPLYKAQRPEKPAELRCQLLDAPALLTAAGIPVVQSRGHEADDVLASAAATCRGAGWRAVLMTSDRDSFALLDQDVSVLRVMDGGLTDSPLLGPDDLVRLYDVRPDQYHDLAALRGDPSDNLPGVPGVGTRTAARLLHRFGSMAGLFAAVDQATDQATDQGQPGGQPDQPGRPDQLGALLPETARTHLASAAGRAAVRRTREIMRLHADLPLPDPESLRLPLDGARLRTALRRRDIRLNRSLWALIGEAPPPWEPNGFDKAPSALPRVEAPPWALSQWYRPDLSIERTTRERARTTQERERSVTDPVQLVELPTESVELPVPPEPIRGGQFSLF